MTSPSITSPSVTSRPTGSREPTSRLLTALVTLGCILLATAVIRLSEPGDNFQVIRGQLGQTVPLNGGTVTVDRMRVGVALAEDGTVAHTAGLFVVVQVTAAAPGRRAIEVSESRLVSGDRVYLPYAELSQVQAEPGFRSAADLVYEVDPARIVGLTIELWQTEIFVGYPQHVRVPLGVSAQTQDRMVAAAQHVTVQSSRNDTTSVI